MESSPCERHAFDNLYPNVIFVEFVDGPLYQTDVVQGRSDNVKVGELVSLIDAKLGGAYWDAIDSRITLET